MQHHQITALATQIPVKITACVQKHMEKRDLFAFVFQDIQVRHYNVTVQDMNTNHNYLTFELFKSLTYFNFYRVFMN